MTARADKRALSRVWDHTLPGRLLRPCPLTVPGDIDFFQGCCHLLHRTQNSARSRSFLGNCPSAPHARKELRKISLISRISIRRQIVSQPDFRRLSRKTVSRARSRSSGTGRRTDSRRCTPCILRGSRTKDLSRVRHEGPVTDRGISAVATALRLISTCQRLGFLAHVEASVKYSPRLWVNVAGIPEISERFSTVTGRSAFPGLPRFSGMSSGVMVYKTRLVLASHSVKLFVFTKSSFAVLAEQRGMKLPTPHAPKLTALEVALLEAYDLETFLAISCTGVDREDSGYASDTLGSGDNLEVPLASTTPRSASNSTFASPATVAHATHTSRGESIPFISYGTYETLPQVEQRTDSGKHRVLPDFGGLYTDEPQALDKRCPTGQQSKSAHREQPVPQPPYERRSNSAAFERQASIECTVNGAGVLLQCVHDNPSELPAAWHIEPVAQPGTVKQKVQIRLNWPGYPPRHRSVNILDFTKSPTPVSKAKFLVSVAKGVKGMMEENARFAPDDASWRIGPGGIEFSHVILLSLEHVAKSSWQPVLSVSSF